MYAAKIFKELILLMEKNPRNFPISQNFLTANNQELENRFHWQLT